MVWKRPENVEYPKVWHRFQGRRPMPDGTVPTFRVQDLPEDRFEDAKNYMALEFLYNEPGCKSLSHVYALGHVRTYCKGLPITRVNSSDAGDDESTRRQMREIWTHCMEDKVALVCFREDPSYPNGYCPDIVGMNVTCISKIEEKGHRVETTGDIFPHIMNAVYECMELADIFKIYGVDYYLSAVGLSVSKEFRGQNIGAEILKARIPMCKALGIKVTCTAFTAIESQVLAKKVGFYDEGEVSYDDLRQKYGYALGPVPNTKSMKLMTMVID